jgi:hypothetical protein
MSFHCGCSGLHAEHLRKHFLFSVCINLRRPCGLFHFHDLSCSCLSRLYGSY